MPSFACRLAAVLPILMLVSVLAHAQGTTPSHTYLAQTTGSAGQIGFVANVRPEAGVGPLFPTATGTVTLYNGATAIGSATTLVAGSGFTSNTFAQVFGIPDPAVAAVAGGAVWGDFNEDRIPDLLVYGPMAGSSGSTQEIQVFLGNLNIPSVLPLPPSYTPVAAQQVALPLQPQFGQSLAVLDVDGDGHLDLLAGNTVAYGKGDGTFGRVAVLPVLASGYSQTYAVDMDGDGKTDIVAVNTPPSVSTPGTVQYAFTVFHNNGAGSFTAMGPYPLAPSFAAGSSVAYNIFGLSFADVNGDRRIDVISQSNVVPVGNAAEPASLNVILNLGTGFSAPKAIDTSGIPDEGMVSISFTNLTNDGKQDLVFSYQANTMNNGVATLLGHGDGTFAAPVNYTIGNTHTIGSPLLPILTEDDVNADGNNDVVLGSGVLLLGNRDGTLTAGTPLFTTTAAPGNPVPVYALPGLPIPLGYSATGGEVIFINLQSGANAVFLPNVGSNATVTPTLAPGTYSLTAHYSGDANYAGSVSNMLNVTVPPSTPAPITMTLTSSASTIYASQPVTFTATLSDPTITGSITFVDTSKIDDFPFDPMAGTTESTLGTGTIANGVATLTTKLLVGGTHTVLAVYGPDISAPIAQAQLTETVNVPFSLSSTAEITLTSAPGKSVSTQLSINALGGFPGPVTFGCYAFQGTCSFSPATVNLTGTAASAVTLTVTATPAPTTAQASPIYRDTMILACGIPLFALFGIAPAGRSRALFAIVAIALFGIACLGCGGGGGSTGGGGQQPSSPSLPAGTYPFYVTATSGQNELAINAVLTVQ
jgi:hypothetical protein